VHWAGVLSCWVPAKSPQEPTEEEDQEKEEEEEEELSAQATPAASATVTAEELRRLKFGALKQRAAAFGIDEAAVHATLDAADDPKAALIDMIVGATAPQQQDSETAAHSTPSTPPTSDASKECPLCFERYRNSSGGLLVPRIAQCGHTVCHGCMSSMLTKKLAQGNCKPYSCPTCRVVTKVPRGKAANLPVVYALMD
jgi:pyruvate/2-oxoglutarate dehydrogenase complex dihydrolipoamide acyltransferase (E2) component